MVNSQHNLGHRIFYWFVVIGISLGICLAYLHRLDWEEPRLGLSQLMDGTAHKPFVYRILVPFLVKAAVHVLPLPPSSYASLLIYCSLFGFVVTIRSFSALYWESDMIVDFIGMISVITLFPLMLTDRHVYDFSTLFLFSLAFRFMAQAKWKSFLLVYTISCLNKETTFLLGLVFFVCFCHMFKERLFWQLLILQIVIYTGLRLAIMWSFHSNPGGMVENHLPDHFYAFERAPLLVLTYAISGLVVVALVVRDWKKKPFFLRRAALGIVPVLFVLYLLWGYPLEIRVFYEAYPVILLLVLPTVGPVLGLQFWAVQHPDAADSRSALLNARC